MSLVIVLFLTSIVVLALVAKRLALPYPIVLTLGGIAIALIPGVPHIELRPELVFAIFLPPLLYGGGWSTDWNAFRSNFRPIGLLSTGCVLLTTVLVAVVAHAVVPEMPWAVAFVLGAIVSPTDTVASLAILQTFAIPRQLVTIIEGESLVNDATALVLYRFAIAAVVTGTFTWWAAGLQFVGVSLGGIAIGLAVGYVSVTLLRFLNRQKLTESAIDNVLYFVFPYASYLSAEAAHVSGVLAAVSAGIYAGRKRAQFQDAETRLVGFATWGMVIFSINGALFVLLGMQLPQTIASLRGYTPGLLALEGAAVVAAVIAARFVWLFPASYLSRYLLGLARGKITFAPWRSLTVLGWTGMRGIISLAAALAIPVTLDGTAPFPARGIVIYLTFCAILGTLVVQGLTLGPLIRALGIKPDGDTARDIADARARVAEAGMRRLHDLEPEFSSPAHWEAAGLLRAAYEQRIEHLRSQLSTASLADGAAASIYHTLRSATLEAERTTAVRMRDHGQINDDVYRALENDLDLSESQLD